MIPKTLNLCPLQVSNLADLWLREGHLENMLSSGAQPLVQSLPWQLMQHAVASQAGGPMEVGLAEHLGFTAEHQLSTHSNGTSGSTQCVLLTW